MTPRELLDHEIVRRRLDGEQPSDIAKDLKIPLAHVLGLMLELGKKARDEAEAHASELFALSNQRLEYLWRVVKRRLDNMPADRYDSRLVKDACSILERQSRLNALDRGQKLPTRSDDWVEEATPEELKTYLSQHGVTL